MKIPTGPTNGRVVLIEIQHSPEKLIPKRYYIAEGRTSSTACVFDTVTETYSDNSIYSSNKGDFIKKNGMRYYLEDFK